MGHLGDLFHPQPEFVLGTAGDAIVQKHAEVSGVIGAPIDDVHFGVGHGVILRTYEQGTIYWTRETGAHEVHGAIRDHYFSLGADASFLGPPVTDESPTGDGVGRFNHFLGGSIFWHPRIGAHEVHGAIRERWAALGSEASFLGYPTSDEHDWTDPAGVPGRASDFQYGQIGWTEAGGTIDLPETRTFNSGPITFPDDTPVDGSAQFIVSSNGHFSYGFHAHDSGALPFHFSTFGVLANGLSADGTSPFNGAGVFGLRHSGTIHGIDPGDRDDDVGGEGDSGLLRTAWPSMRNAQFRVTMSAHDSFSDAFSDVTDAIRNFLRGLFETDPGEKIGVDVAGYRSDIRDV